MLGCTISPACGMAGALPFDRLKLELRTWCVSGSAPWEGLEIRRGTHTWFRSEPLGWISMAPGKALLSQPLMGKPTGQSYLNWQ